MDPGILKSLHIIFVVTWFAGLFYIFRLFVYHKEAELKEQPERDILTRQYIIMERRLWYIITWPSAILTLIWGIWLLIKFPAYLQLPFMHVKLTFVFLLLLYQVWGEVIIRRLAAGTSRLTSTRLRMLNEIPTIILIAVVFLIVKRDSLSWMWGILSILGIAVILMVAIKAYKRLRER
ncbi:MAG: CopD family protein [Flavobacteriales bacterium]|nr:CopD family protein [Flavobacteriales bacterium]